jgi:hypothetical protein
MKSGTGEPPESIQHHRAKRNVGFLRFDAENDKLVAAQTALITFLI